jgi:alkylation response protein AidB-like acyl-CoA dehydrogenase
MEACGEALVVEPLLDNVGLAGGWWRAAGSDAQRAALLPGLIDGTRRWPSPTWNPAAATTWRRHHHRARATNGGWVLDGTKCVVVGAPRRSS